MQVLNNFPLDSRLRDRSHSVQLLLEEFLFFERVLTDHNAFALLAVKLVQTKMKSLPLSFISGELGVLLLLFNGLISPPQESVDSSQLLVDTLKSLVGLGRDMANASIHFFKTQYTSMLTLFSVSQLTSALSSCQQ